MEEFNVIVQLIDNEVITVISSNYATKLDLQEYSKTDDLENLSSEVERKANKLTGKNLFNIDDPDNTLDYYVNPNNGNLAYNTSYNATNYIQVEGGENYTVNFKHWCAFYDSEKVFISGSDTINTSGETILIPNNAVFIRCGTSKGAWAGFQLEKGTVSTAWEPYEIKGLESFTEKTELTEAVTGLNSQIDKKASKVPGKNLFNINDPDSIPDKFISETTGEVMNGNENYLASHFIEVEPGETYSLSYGNRTAFYDENKVFISGENSSSNTRTAPNNAKYIRVTTNNVSTFQIERGFNPTSFEPFELTGLDSFLKRSDFNGMVHPVFNQDDNTPFDNTYIKESISTDITPTFDEDSAQWLNTTSTFSGWGTAIGMPQNFNSVYVKVRARDTEITKIRFRVFVGDATGAVLKDKILNVSILPFETKDILCVFDDLIENATGEKLFLIWQCNQFVDRYGASSSSILPTSEGNGWPRFVTNGSLTSVGTLTTSGSERTYVKTAISIPIVGFSDTFIGYIQEKIGLPEIFEPKAEILLPSNIYTTENVEMNIFWENVIFSNIPLEQLKIKVTCNLGNHYERGWRYIPSGSAANSNLTIDVFYLGTLLATKTTTVITNGINDGQSSLKVLCIGDSTTANGNYVSTITTDYNTNPTVTFIGTQGSGINKHEGHSGKTFDWFVNNTESPFWNSSTNQLDFSNYLTTNSFTLQSTDLITIHLGINDVFHSISETKLNTIKNNCDTLITNIRNDVPDINIVILVTIPPAISQDAFGVSYSNSHILKQYLEHYKEWVSFLIDNYDTIENRNNKIFVAQMNCNIDRKFNFPKSLVPANSRTTEQIERWSNGVHPALSGYQQMGDSLWMFIKNL
ncbi:SGNH/GDSL hydrolase family protein [Cyclobacterium plantarum]|uniref:SGNH hydrolase-type esterase domain-containing protein n=1 Tax=Cyclobacterium plantarum TaxID=2716263 RepID=A0ABX0HC73_9BACT|nr:SGNH/GDSL hydrolase family protein [Cyclobacterium plantarum]NHE57949.1 hypothetical protein [Cyclobacterium plantarum]